MAEIKAAGKGDITHYPEIEWPKWGRPKTYIYTPSVFGIYADIQGWITNENMRNKLVPPDKTLLSIAKDIYYMI
jgi:hypothetical protein